jgi:hypothetical protein
MTWKFWTQLRPKVVKHHVQSKLSKIGIEKGVWVAKRVFFRLKSASLVHCWEHWRELMDEFHEVYFTGQAAHQSKMQYELKLKRIEAKEQFKQERSPFELENISPYRFEIRDAGGRYFPEFDLLLPSWCPPAVFIAFLYSYRQVRLVTRRIHAVSTSKWVDDMVSLAVTANTILICCEHSRRSPFGQAWGAGSGGDVMHVRFQAQMELGFIALLCVYAFECCMKVIGHGFFGYFRKPANVFDFLLVLIGIVQLPLNFELWRCESTRLSIEDCEIDSSGITALRVLRLVRVIKSFRYVSMIHAQISIILGVMRSSYSLIFLFVGYTLLFASLGNHLFFSSFSIDVGQDRHSLGLGTQVWVRPSRSSVSDLPGRPGVITNFSGYLRPWVATFVTSFSELGSNSGVAQTCLKYGACSDEIKSVLPRENFSSFTQSILTVLQIMMRSGWTQVFQISVSGAGYALSCIYFYTILLTWSYFLGNICGVVLIGGFSKKFDGEKELLKAAAVKEMKMHILHKEFKKSLVANYLDRFDLQSSSSKGSSVDQQSKRLRLAMLKASCAKAESVGNNAKSSALWHDPFENAFGNHSQQNSMISVLREITHGPAKASSNLNNSFGGPSGGSKNRPVNVLSNFDANNDLSVEYEFQKIQRSIEKMTEFEREMYLREGLTNVEIGRHVAKTLGVAAILLERRIEHLQREWDESAGINIAIYYEQQMRPLRIRLKELNRSIQAMQCGHQTGLAWFILRPYHPIRCFSCRVATSVFFERFMGSMVLLSCITLWFQQPEMTRQNTVLLDNINSFLNFSFLMECLLKVLKFNFVWCHIFCSTSLTTVFRSQV